MSNLATAIALASDVFKDKFDKSGEPYILHCLYVMNKVGTKNKTRAMVAVLHDVIEDTDLTSNDLLRMGFPFGVVHRVQMLTHDPAEDYMDYIRRVATDPDCKAVKLADLEHNTKLNRLKGLREKDFNRMQKYITAYTFLNN